MAEALQANGYKVIVYVATQGPAMTHAGGRAAFDRGIFSNNDRLDPDCNCTPYMKNWYNLVASVYGDSSEENLKKAFADIIINEYAERYGSKIDGWWFDQAHVGNCERIRDVIKRHNPNAAIAFNKGQNNPLTVNQPSIEDFTAGHPNPIVNTPSNSVDNLPMIESIEATSDGFLQAETGEKSLGHMFIPLCTKWDVIGTENVWNVSQAADWMKRVQEAKGAWTWNIPRNSNKPDTFHLVDLEHIEFIKKVVSELK